MGTVEVEVYVGSFAALGVVNRKGNGKLRHVRVGQLWIQQTAEEEVLGFKKINVPSETGAKSVINGIVHTVLLETVNV